MRNVLLGSLLVLWQQAAVGPAHASPRECIAANERAAAKKARGEFSSAREEYLACAGDECPKIIREECAALVASLDAVMPTVILAVVDERGEDAQAVSVTIDDRSHAAGVDGRAFAIDPGQHVFRFAGAAGQSREVHVVIREGEKNRTVRVEMPAEKPTLAVAALGSHDRVAASETRPVPSVAYALGAVGLGALGSFTYFALRGRAQQADLEERCAPNCRPDEASAMRSKYLAADISLAVAAISLGGATYLYFSRPSMPGTAAGSPRDSLASGLEVRLTGTF